MRKQDDLEKYMIQLGLPFERVGETMWIIDETPAEVVVSWAETMLVLRLKLMELPDTGKLEDFFRKLLVLNATEMTHGAFGIEGNTLVITDTLELENMDLNEFQASVESLVMAAQFHHQALKLAL
jgi:hypothetical protein